MARGSIFRRSGGWAFRVDAGFHADSGKRRQVLRQGFATKRAAEVALAEMVGGATRGMAVSSSTMKLGAYLDEWFVTAKQSLRATTAHGYQQAIVRLKQHLGPYRMQALTPMQVQRCYTELLQSGSRTGGPLAPATVHKAHEVLRRALGDAERMGLVSRNVAAAVRPPTAGKPELTTWSSEDLRDFLVAIRGIRSRWGSACSRRRDCVAGRCSACVGATSTSTSPSSRSPTRSPRSELSTSWVRRRRRRAGAWCTSTGARWPTLREHRQRQRQQRLAAGPAWDSAHDWVLTDALGGYVRPYAMSYEWRRLMEQLDVPTIRLQDLRHTHATLALKAGVHPKVVSERLGHATVGITLDLYSHVAPSLAKDAAEQIMSSTYSDDGLGLA